MGKNNTNITETVGASIRNKLGNPSTLGQLVEILFGTKEKPKIPDRNDPLIGTLREAAEYSNMSINIILDMTKEYCEDSLVDEKYQTPPKLH